MRLFVTASAIAILLSTPAAFAQSQTSNSPTSQSSASSDQSIAAASRIQRDLKSAGFTDVKVVAQSFVVQAKSKDGNPVLMTIGPHGMSVFEALNSSNAGSPSGTTGSAGNSSK